MTLNIKDVETERLVRQLTSATGESVTDAVSVAVQERLERLTAGNGPSRDERLARIREISADASVRWVLDVSGDELLYDEQGLPR